MLLRVQRHANPARFGLGAEGELFEPIADKLRRFQKAFARHWRGGWTGARRVPEALLGGRQRCERRAKEPALAIEIGVAQLVESLLHAVHAASFVESRDLAARARPNAARARRRRED